MASSNDSETRSFPVVGTAGHIDHGKSTLVKALTGTDPDRLKEEKERGITIDLGFAFMDLGGGVRVAFVDVPGHERFVKNMLAGAGGVDAALLVVAADESVMPQTREHLDILRLLRVPRGIVALTKAALADPEMRSITAMEVKELLAGTFLEEAPALFVDSLTGEGLPELKEALRRLARAVPPRPADGTFRLPVDRAFALKGFGTVVTGTAVGGVLAAGGTVAVLPSGKASRVRTVEVAGELRQEARAGQRVALNLPDLEVADVVRGDVVAPPGLLVPTKVLHVRVEVLPGSPSAIEARDRLRLHLGAAEILARVKLRRGSEAIPPGGSAIATLLLETETVAVRGDRFVLRRYSPVATIAGGRVLLPRDPPGTHRAVALAALLDALDDAPAAEAALALVAHAGSLGATPSELATYLGETPEAVAAALREAVAAGRAATTDAGRLVVTEEIVAAEGTLLAAVAEHHGRAPLDPGIPREHLRGEVLPHAPADVFRMVLSRLDARGALVQEKDVVRLPGFVLAASEGDAGALRDLEAAYREGGLNPPSLDDVLRRLGIASPRSEPLVAHLVRQGRLRRIGGSLLFHEAVLEELCDRVRALLPGRTTLSVGEFKDLVGTSRKFAIPLLEHLDARRVTARAGDLRRILPGPAR